MTQPTTPTGPDLAQVMRQEARKTRTLIVTLVIGLSLAGLLTWLIIVGVSSSHIPTGATIPTGPALSGPALDETSSCAQYTAANNQTTPHGETNPAAYFLAQHSVPNVLAFTEGCATSPGSTLGDMIASQTG